LKSWQFFQQNPQKNENRQLGKVLIMTEYSAAPTGERFPIPQENEYPAELRRIQALADQARKEGKEIVVVMGVGFVGVVMAASGPAPEATGKSRCLTRASPR
jgi:hypothetical protein